MSGVVALGSPLVDQLALHPIARLHVSFVGRLGSLGTPGLFRRECLTGDCCTEIRDAAERPLPERVGFVSIYSRSDGVVDWRSCLDPRARPVEISSSHVGMAVSAAAYGAIGEALGSFDRRRKRRPAPARRPGLEARLAVELRASFDVERRHSRVTGRVAADFARDGVLDSPLVFVRRAH